MVLQTSLEYVQSRGTTVVCEGSTVEEAPLKFS